MTKNRLVTLAIVVIGLAVLVTFTIVRTSDHRLRVRTYFGDAAGLRPGAPVRMAGVDVGNVVSVRARPELKEKAAEVVMDIRTTYDLSIPKDAIVSLETAGVLGEPFIAISVKNAAGSPIEHGGMLESQEMQPATSNLLQRLGEVLKPAPCQPSSEKSGTSKPK